MATKAPISGEIVAGANALRQKTQEQLESNRGRRRKFGFLPKKKKDTSQDEAEQKALKAEIEMDEHKISLDELVTRLGTNLETGLTTKQHATILEDVGLNRLTPPATTPWWVLLLATQTGFFALLLWFGAVLCFVGYALKNEQENLYLGIVLSLVVSLTGIFSFFQEQKSSNLMDSFKNMMPSSTQVIRNGTASEIDALQLVPGDLVKLKFGDKVPADVRVVECTDDMKVDNASLTGESEAQKRENKCTHENPLETRNLCFFGTFIPTGTAKCVVVSTGDNTLMGRIARLSLTTASVETPIAKEIEHFVKIVSAVAIFLGLTFFIIGVVLGTDMLTNLVFMIGIIVANVPEGLLATVTVCLTLTAKRMHSKSVLVKNLEGVETLGSTSCICSDKTGTLTQNIMTVSNIVYDLNIWDVESTMGPANFNDEDKSFKSLSRCATLCNTAVWDETSKKDAQGNAVPFTDDVVMGDGSTMHKVMWKPLGDASESAMIKFVQTKHDIIEYRNNCPLNARGKIPFNSANKYQAHVNWVPELNQWVNLVKGAPERVTSRCKTILLNGEEVEMTEEHLKKIDDLQLQLSRRGMRVLGFAEKKLDATKYPKDYAFDAEGVNFALGESQKQYDERAELAATGGEEKPSERCMESLCYLGMMALIDPPRPQVPPAVAKCKTAGIKVIMVTGDHPETAKAISKKVGIIWGETQDDIEFRNKANNLKEGMAGWEDPHLAPAIVVPGWDISVDTPDEVWDDILAHPQVVFARTSPQQKLVIVENCQRRRHVVAVTGDGVNDSPALKKADIGVAMGIMGTDVSKEAADMILLDDNFASIVCGVEEGRLIFDNLKKSIAYTLSSNIPEISPFLAFILVQIPLPLSTILILCVDLGTDMIPAISMAWENPEADIMARNPRDADVDRLVTRKLVSFAYLQIGVIQALSGFYTYLTVLNDYGFAPWLLPGLGAVDNWEKQTLLCQVTDGAWKNYGGEICPCFVDLESEAGLNLCGGITGKWWEEKHIMNKFITRCQQIGYMYWDQDETLSYVDSNGAGQKTGKGSVEECRYPMKHVGQGGVDSDGPADDFTVGDRDSYYNSKGELHTSGKLLMSKESIQALRGSPENCLASETDPNNGCLFYYEYLPFRGVRSQFFNRKWGSWEVADSGVTGLADALRSVALAYQPVGYFTDLAEADGDGINVGHILNTKSLSTDENNPDRVESLKYRKAELIQTPSVEWVNYFSTNELNNTFWEPIVANAADKEMATITLQASRCQNSCTSQPGFLEIYKTQMSTSPETEAKLIEKLDALKPSCELEVFNTFVEQIEQGAVRCFNDADEEAQTAEALLTNVASRQIQKEALHNAQSASFIGIIIVQWADLVICKTRWLSIREQGMQNAVMNFALIFELLLGALLSYVLPIGVALGTRPLRITHWMPAMPFSIFIFLYDELRKYFMRQTSTIDINKVTGRSTRHPGWLERNTYY